MAKFNHRKIYEEVTRDAQNALAKAMARGSKEAVTRAGSKLKRTFALWAHGHHLYRVDENTWVLALEGDLANMFEDGFGPGAIKKAVLKGRDYVDVPMREGAKNGTKLKISMHRDLDSMVKAMSTNKGVSNSKLKDFKAKFKDRKKADGFVEFQRVSKNTPNNTWPTTPFSGAHAFEGLENLIFDYFYEEFERD